MVLNGVVGTAKRRFSPPLIAGIAALALTACQASSTQREAPTPVALYGGAVQPLTEPVVLRYRPLGAVQLAATMENSADVSNHHFTRSNSISGRATIESAGEGLLRYRVMFQVGAHQLDEDLDVEPFVMDMLMTDLGEIQDVIWQFAASDRLSNARKRSIIGTIAHLFPILSWPETGIEPGEAFSAVFFQVSNESVVVGETGAIDLRIDGETVYDGRPAYLVGFSGRAQSGSTDEALSGYYIVDAQSGFILEHRFVGRDKDYFQQFVVYRDYDVEAHLRP